MIISKEPQVPSYDGGDHDQATPPPYQERVPPSQLLPNERLTTSVYAPSVSSRSEPPREVEKELPPHPAFPDEKSKGKEKGGECPTQRALDVFSSMIWGTSSAPTSPNPASTSRTSTVQVQDLLNPAPAAFTRPTPKNYAYLPFQPMTMLGISEKLADGFPMIPPPINSEDETSASKANAQHPFVSHDITQEDWLKFLADLKIVTTTPNQTQKSFLARIFHGEPSERDRRKQAVRFIDSWNHYFFQPRRMNVVLARGRRTFSGASNNRHPHPPGRHRRHSIGHDRGRGIDPTQTGSQRYRHRSLSTDSSDSDSSTSSSSIHSTASGPPEMPVPHIGEPSPGGPFDGRSSKERGCGGRGRRGHHHSTRTGWCAPGTAGPSTAPPMPGLRGGLEGGEPGSSHEKSSAYREQKRAWKVEERGMKYERRRMKRAARFERRAVKYERGQRKRELKAARRAEGHTGGDDLWKLLIFHGARGETGQL